MRKQLGSPGTRTDMCVAMMSVQPKWSLMRYSAARSQRACHSASVIWVLSAEGRADIVEAPVLRVGLIGVHDRHPMRAV